MAWDRAVEKNRSTSTEPGGIDRTKTATRDIKKKSARLGSDRKNRKNKEKKKKIKYMERETNAVRKKAKNDDIIGDNDLLELLDKYIDLKIYMSEVMEGDSYAAPLDRSNPLRALFYTKEQKQPPVSLFRCANSECQEIVPYQKNLERARLHALAHYNALVRNPALAQMQGPTISMGPRDPAAGAAG